MCIMNYGIFKLLIIDFTINVLTLKLSACLVPRSGISELILTIYNQSGIHTRVVHHMTLGGSVP